MRATFRRSGSTTANPINEQTLLTISNSWLVNAKRDSVGVVSIATSTALFVSRVGVVRFRAYIIALTDEAYDETTLSSVVSFFFFRWHPAACIGKYFKRPVGIHHTYGQLPPVGASEKLILSNTGQTIVSQSHSRTSGVPLSLIRIFCSILARLRSTNGTLCIWSDMLIIASQHIILTLMVIGPESVMNCILQALVSVKRCWSLVVAESSRPIHQTPFQHHNCHASFF